MHRATLAVVGAILVGSAAWGGRPAGPPGPPDLSGTWKLQADSAPGGRRPGGGGPSGSPGGRLPEGGPGRRPGGIPGPGLDRTLTIAQTDSTVTMTGERGPARTYFTDGREVRHELGDSASVTVRARWDQDDLIIERQGEEWSSVEAYRFDGKGPRLIVIVEITPHEGARDGPRSLRTNRIYERSEPSRVGGAHAPPAGPECRDGKRPAAPRPFSSSNLRAIPPPAPRPRHLRGARSRAGDCGGSLLRSD